MKRCFQHSLSTHGLSRTQYSHNIQQADTVSDDTVSSPTVRVEKRLLMGVRAAGGERGRQYSVLARPADDLYYTVCYISYSVAYTETGS